MHVEHAFEPSSFTWMKGRPRSWVAALACAALCLGCQERESTRLLEEARARERDAGTVQPKPAGATLLTAHQNIPRGLVIAGDSLYWINEGRRAEGDPGLFRMPKEGGEPVMLAKGKGFQELAVDEENVYWTNAEAEVVLQVSRRGGTPRVLAAEQNNPTSLQLDASSVYWLAGDAVWRVDKAGGKAVELFSGLGQPAGLAVDDTSVYWYSTFSGKLMRGPKKGRAPRAIAEEETTLHGFFIDERFVYWSFGNQGSAQVRRLAKAGGKPASVVTGQAVPAALAQDTSSVYWASEDAIFRADKGGGAAIKVVDRPDEVTSIATDGAYVYWTDRTGRVQRLSK